MARVLETAALTVVFGGVWLALVIAAHYLAEVIA